MDLIQLPVSGLASGPSITFTSSRERAGSDKVSDTLGTDGAGGSINAHQNVPLQLLAKESLRDLQARH